MNVIDLIKKNSRFGKQAHEINYRVQWEIKHYLKRVSITRMFYKI